MRPFHIADIDVAVRYLLSVPQADWSATAHQIVKRADLADRFRKRLARAHPEWGTGTLATAIPARVGRAYPAHCDGTYLAALAVLINALQSHRFR
ncbi:DUF7742 family protein [Yoonia sp. 208BN28-4]|uniref:DUF7742 family protein n=1 Tax=Yoonia sp. 208BN28-4 TaxID=3126505 RepID=UPI0030ACCB66